MEGPGWRAYREVLEVGLGQAAEGLGIDLGESGTRALVDNWGQWPISDDVERGLTELRDAGWKLVVLTNCDNDLGAGTVEHLPIRLDDAITAEQVRSYKPELGHFRAFRERISDDALWVHAANSWLHDMVPARRSGVATVWVDRDLTGHPGDFPDRHVHDIKSLPATITELEPQLRPVSQSI